MWAASALALAPPLPLPLALALPLLVPLPLALPLAFALASFLTLALFATLNLAVPSQSHKHRQPKFDPRIDAKHNCSNPSPSPNLAPNPRRAARCMLQHGQWPTWLQHGIAQQQVQEAQLTITLELAHLNTSS